MPLPDATDPSLLKQGKPRTNVTATEDGRPEKKKRRTVALPTDPPSETSPRCAGKMPRAAGAAPADQCAFAQILRFSA